jgi:hypothetical protein
VAWIVRLVKTGDDCEEQCIDLTTINRPDNLGDVANSGLTLAEGKHLLSGPPTGDRCRTGQEPHRSAAGLPKLWKGLPREGQPGP